MTAQEAPTALTELLVPPRAEQPQPGQQPQAEPATRRRGRTRGRAATRPGSARRAAAPTAAASAPAPAASAIALTIGGEPRVDLLPPEIKAKRATRVLQSRLLTGVLIVLVLVVAAVGGAWVVAMSAQQELAQTQARTGTLAAQQLKYSKVSQLESQTQLVQNAQHVAGATEIDWQSYLNQVQATLPAGVTVQTVKVDSETVLAAYAQPNTPLLGPRVATITFTASSAQLPDVPLWLDALATLPGFADANPDTVNLTAGQYSATITMHVNAKAFDNRFAPKGK